MTREIISTAIIHGVDNDMYYFQYRNGKDQKGALNTTGLVGGKIEESETPEQAIIRESMEEAIMRPAPKLEQYKFLTKFPWDEVIGQEVVVFWLELEPGAFVEMTEGDTVRLKRAEFAEVESFSPVVLKLIEGGFFDGAEHHKS